MISELIIRDIKDPRIGFTTITRVELSMDSSTAHVGVSVLGNESNARLSLEGLKSASGYIHHKIYKVLRMKNTPRIEFFLDTSVSEGVSLINLIEKANRGEDEKIESTPGAETGKG